MPYTLIPEGNQNHEGDNPAVSPNNNIRTAAIEPQSNNTERIFRSTETRCNLRGNPTPKKYTDLPIHQLNDARAAIGSVNTRGEGTEPQTRQHKNIIGKHPLLRGRGSCNCPPTAQQKPSKIMIFQTNTFRNHSLVNRIRKKFKNEQKPNHIHSASTKTHVAFKRTHKKVIFLLNT